MKLHLLPFGEPAWALRREIFREKILSRPGPPFDFRDMLYLVPNERSIRTLRALFLEVLHDAAGARACIPPTFEALNRLLERKAFSVSKKPVLDRLARELVIEDISAKAATDFPGLLPGPSLSPMVADALDKIYSFGLKDGAWEHFAEDSLPLSLLRAVKAGYEKWLGKNGLADPSAARAAYSPAPGDFPFRKVILDGFYDADPAETRLMKALTELPDSYFILQAPGIDTPGACEKGRPYYGTGRLLSELALKPDSAGENDAGLFIGAAFTGRPLKESFAEAQKGVSRRVTVASAVNTAEEVYFIARKIKDACRERGADPDRILVFFPSVEPYLPTLRQAFSDYGIPYHISQGTPLISTPASRALLSVLSLPLEKYGFKAMRKVFSSPLMGFREAAADFDKAARNAGLAGKRETWERLAREVSRENAPLSQSLRRLLDLSRKLESPKKRSAREWAGAALALLGESGITDEQLTGTLERLMVRTAPAEGALSLPESFAFLKRALRDNRHRVPQDAVSGVRVLGRHEISSEPFDIIFAAGLAEGVLPAPPRRDLFFSDPLSEKFGMPGSMDAVSRDARLFLSLALGAPETYLLYPESGLRGAASPSPYITALEPLIRAGAVDKIDRWQRPDDPRDALGVEELARALALHTDGEQALMLASEASEKVPGFAWPVIAREPSAVPAAGRLREKEKFSVTELEEYILCGYKYYLTRVLGRPPEDPEEDIDAGSLGTLVHEILRDFINARKKGRGDADPLGLLREIGDKRFGELPETAQNKGRRRWFLESVAPAFVEAEETLREGGFSVAGTEQRVEAPVTSEDGETFVLTGKLDRIEVDAQGNFNVVDYKTGKYPGNKRPLSDQFQLPLYAYMLKAKGDETSSARRPASFVYYNLKSEKMRDVVCYDAEVASGPARRKKTGDEMDELIKACLEKALDAVKGIRAGVFSAEPDNPRMCVYCEFKDSCRKEASEEDAEDIDGPAEG